MLTKRIKHQTERERRRQAVVGLVLSGFMILLVSVVGASQSRRVVDEILAVVNGSPITRSDLLWSLALDSRAPSPSEHLSSDVLKRKLEVLIDERLIFQEAASLPTSEITDEEIGRKRADLIRQFGSENGFRQRVEAAGLTAERVEDLLKQRIVIDRFIDFRFRSFVFVGDQEIARYYEEELVPRIKASGRVAPPLTEVREQIQAILREEKVNQEIDKWLAEARQRADVVQLVEP